MLLTTWAKSLYKTCHSLNPERQLYPGMGRWKNALRCVFSWLLNINMIASIRFSNFVAEPKPPAPIGDATGYGTIKVATPVPVHNLKVKTNG